MTSKVYNKQIGGTHYRQMKIQPSRFVIENELLFPEGSVIKYICRHPYKGGKEDLEKAKHFIDMIIERDYGPEESWIDGYNKWKKQGVISDKVKLGELKKLLKKERCPHN
jgi:hypothetical protein